MAQFRSQRRIPITAGVPHKKKGLRPTLQQQLYAKVKRSAAAPETKEAERLQRVFEEHIEARGAHAQETLIAQLAFLYARKKTPLLANQKAEQYMQRIAEGKQKLSPRDKRAVNTIARRVNATMRKIEAIDAEIARVQGIIRRAQHR